MPAPALLRTLALISPPDVHVHPHAHEHAHADGTVHAHAHAHPSAEIQHHEHVHDAETGSPPRDWTVGAFVDVAYAVSSNFPDNHRFRGQARAARTGEISLNLAGAYLFHEPRRARPFRLQLALQAGSDLATLFPGEPGGAFVEVLRHLGPTNAAVVAPWGWARGFSTETGAGVYASPLGIGSAWSRNEWNYTPAWAKSATPFYLLGAHVTQHLGPRARVAAWVLNGWAGLGDINRAPSYMLSLVLTPAEGLTLAEHVWAGPEQQDPALAAFRVYSDTQVRFDRPAAGIAAFGDYGQEQRTDLPGRPVVRWAGGAVAARARVRSFRRAQWDMALRPEVFWDQSGAVFGRPQWLLGVTYTNGVQLFDHLLARVEYRYDRSSRPDGYFWVDHATSELGPLARDQHTVFFALVGYFEHSFAGSHPPRCRSCAHRPRPAR